MKSVICFLCLFAALAVGRAETLRFSGAFTDHAVLQRDVSLPITGVAEPGETVTITLGSAKARTKADANGAWIVTLPAQKAGGPLVLTVTGKTKVELKDILVGDVWFFSGQSNMAGTLNSYATPEELAAIDAAGVRVFSQWHGTRAIPAPDVEGSWVRATPENAPVFSAIAWYVGQRLNSELNIPIGVVVSAVGGTNIVSWSGPEAFKANPETTAKVIARVAELQAQYSDKVDDRGFETAEFDDAAWGEMPAPGEWEKAGLGLDDFDGMIWVRKKITIPTDWAGRDLVLNFGPIDDRDVTYFNGVQVGAMGPETPLQWQTPRVYNVPGKLVKAGEAVIAVRISDKLGGGGFLGTPEAMSLEVKLAANEAPEATGMVSLAGTWRYRVVERWPSGNEPTTLYQNMVTPWFHTPVRGFVWYQGESNASGAKQYRGLLREMIADWRKQWGLGDLPFVVVQLPEYGPVKDEPADSNWASLREAQAQVADEVPGVSLVVTMGLGDPKNIHPKRKREVGERIAALTLGQVYGKSGVLSGPVFARQEIEGGAIRVSFTGTGGGLESTDGVLKGFAIAGQDRAFVWADAKIEGNTVVVSAANVTQPLYVRYGWADSPTCTLANKEGYPAAPFRTDGAK